MKYIVDGDKLDALLKEIDGYIRNPLKNKIKQALKSTEVDE